MHADLIVDGETGRLQYKMDHYYVRSFDHMIAKMTRYANWGAAQMFIDGKTTNLFGIIGHPLAKFVRDYVVNFGFLDGARGAISVGMHVYYTFWKYAKLWELTQLKRLGRPVPLPKLDNVKVTHAIVVILWCFDHVGSARDQIGVHKIDILHEYTDAAITG